MSMQAQRFLLTLLLLCISFSVVDVLIKGKVKTDLIEKMGVEGLNYIKEGNLYILRASGAPFIVIIIKDNILRFQPIYEKIEGYCTYTIEIDNETRENITQILVKKYGAEKKEDRIESEDFKIDFITKTLHCKKSVCESILGLIPKYKLVECENDTYLALNVSDEELKNIAINEINVLKEKGILTFENYSFGNYLGNLTIYNYPPEPFVKFERREPVIVILPKKEKKKAENISEGYVKKIRMQREMRVLWRKYAKTVIPTILVIIISLIILKWKKII